MDIKIKPALRSAAAVLAMVLTVTACGLFVDDEQRIANAREYLEQGDYSAATVELKKLLQENGDHAEGRYLLGRASLYSGNGIGAEKELRTARQLGYADASLDALLAQAMLAQNKHEQVLEEFKADDAQNPADRARTLEIRGRAHAAAGRAEQAEADFKAALQADPRMFDAEVGLAQLARTRGDLPEARRRLERVLAADDRHARALLEYAVLAQIDGDLDEAEQRFTRVIEMREDPSRDILPNQELAAYSGLVDVRMMQGRLEQAAGTVERMEQQFPGHPYAAYLRALISYGQGDYQSAANDLYGLLQGTSDFPPGQILLGMVLYNQGKYEQADDYLSKGVEFAPENQRLRKMLAATKLKLNEPKEAIAVLAPSALEGEADGAALGLLGKAQIQSGNIEAGLDFLEQGVQANPDDAGVMVEAATAYLGIGEVDRAMQMLDKLSADERSGYQSEALRVLAYLRKGEIARAVDQLESTVEQYPDDGRLRLLAGEVYMAADRPDEARSALERAVDLDGESSARPYLALARLQIMQQDRPAAEQVLRRAVKQHPDDVQSLLLMARVAGAGDPAAAAEWYDRAVAAAPGDPVPKLAKLRYLLARNEYKEAGKLADRAVSQYPDRPDFKQALALALDGSGQTGRALETLDSALKTHPESASLHYVAAQFYTREDRDEHARRAFRRARELAPDNAAIAAKLALFEADRGRLSDGLEVVRALQSRYPDSPVPGVLEGDVYAVSGEYSSALQAYQKADKLHGPTRELTLKQYRVRERLGLPSEDILKRWLDSADGDTEVRYLYARQLQQNGKTQASIAAYERVVEARPEDPVALNNLAWLYHRNGDSRAVEVAEKANRISPDNGAITDTLGWILVQQGDLDRGAALLEKAVEQAPDAPEIQYHLAVARAKKGDTDAAREHLNRILGSEADFESRHEAKQLLDSL